MEHQRRGRLVLSRILTVAETGSTNADMLELARAGAEEGLWLRADRQTGGRGRRGRAWESPVGNLYASTLVRLRPTDPPAATLALVTAVALQEVVRAFARGVEVVIKWPNDLLLAGAKLAGILLERGEDAVVIGIGVNLTHRPDLPDRPATSLADHSATVTPEDFLAELAPILSHRVRRWRGEGLEPVRRAWLSGAHPIGTALTVNLPDGDSIVGLFDGLDRDGALLLRLADGSVRTIHAGDVFLV